MSTESDRSSEYRHQGSGSAEEPQRAGTSGQAWPGQVVPSWSAPPGLIAPQAAAPDAERPDVTPAEAEPASDDVDFPGVAAPAGWFLRSPASGPADGPQTADAEENVTGEWFAPPAPEPSESPISWYEGMDDPAPDSVPFAPASEPPAQPAAIAAAEPAVEPAASIGNGSAPAGPAPSRRSVLAAEPVVIPTRALRGRPGGPGLPPRRPGLGARKAPADLSPWQTLQRLWNESEIPWDRRPADAGHQPYPFGPDRPEPGPRPPAPHRNPPPPLQTPPRRRTPPQQARPPSSLGRSSRRRGHRTGHRSGNPQAATSGRDRFPPSR